MYIYDKEKRRIYGQSPAGRKSNIIGLWKFRGVVGDLSNLYDNYYINKTHCDVCKTEFKSSRDRCLDHCHTTGNYRQTLCQNCNRCDNWMNLI